MFFEEEMCYFYFAVIFIILFLVSFPIVLTEICHDTRGCRTCLGRMSWCKVVFLFSSISVCPSNIPLSFENGTALLWLRIYYLSTANASVVRPKPRGFVAFCCCCFWTDFAVTGIDRKLLQEILVKLDKMIDYFGIEQLRLLQIIWQKQ